jgi:hypothetical protein
MLFKRKKMEEPFLVKKVGREGIGSSQFSNEMGASDGIYEFNVGTYFFLKLNNIESCTPLDTQTLNLDHNMNTINFI